METTLIAGRVIESRTGMRLTTLALYDVTLEDGTTGKAFFYQECNGRDVETETVTAEESVAEAIKKAIAFNEDDPEEGSDPNQAFTLPNATTGNQTTLDQDYKTILVYDQP